MEPLKNLSIMYWKESKTVIESKDFRVLIKTEIIIKQVLDIWSMSQEITQATNSYLKVIKTRVQISKLRIRMKAVLKFKNKAMYLILLRISFCNKFAWNRKNLMKSIPENKSKETVKIFWICLIFSKRKYQRQLAKDRGRRKF